MHSACQKTKNKNVSIEKNIKAILVDSLDSFTKQMTTEICPSNETVFFPSGRQGGNSPLAINMAVSSLGNWADSPKFIMNNQAPTSSGAKSRRSPFFTYQVLSKEQIHRYKRWQLGRWSGSYLRFGPTCFRLV